MTLKMEPHFLSGSSCARLIKEVICFNVTEQRLPTSSEEKFRPLCFKLSVISSIQLVSRFQAAE